MILKLISATIIMAGVTACNQPVDNTPDPYTITVQNRFPTVLEVAIDGKWVAVIPCCNSYKTVSLQGGIHIVEYYSSTYYRVDTISSRTICSIPN